MKQLWLDLPSFTLFSSLSAYRPVSAYALFFRDTQAAIKGQNPSASFGEVSKIVASMWDVLPAEHKNVSSDAEYSKYPWQRVSISWNEAIKIE